GAVGINVANTGSSATIQGNTVRGLGANNFIAQNGIQVLDGATAIITGNTVSGNRFAGTEDVLASGIILSSAGRTTIQGNELFDNDVGVHIGQTTGARVVRNNIHDDDNGIVLADGGGNDVQNNRIRNMDDFGILVI